jgi:hypothetical protein
VSLSSARSATHVLVGLVDCVPKLPCAGSHLVHRELLPPPSEAAAWHEQREALLQDVTAALGRTTAGAGAAADEAGAVAAADHAMQLLLVPSAVAACSFVPAPSHHAN